MAAAPRTARRANTFYNIARQLRHTIYPLALRRVSRSCGEIIAPKSDAGNRYDNYIVNAINRAYRNVISKSH